jgi:flagellar motor switch protein FliG
MTANGEDGSKISGSQKAAILLVTLGEKLGGEILKQLSEEEVKSVSKAIARLEKVTPNQTEAVLEEFCQSTMGGGGRGGFDYAKRMLSSAFGPEGARRLSEALPKGVRANKSIESLQKADPTLLSRFIEGEHPQTIALVLSHLSAAQAASLIANLPPALRSDVVVRIAELDRVSNDVVARISLVIGEKLKSIGQVKSEPHGGPRSVAEILNRMDSAVSEEILTNMQEQQALVDEIRQ